MICTSYLEEILMAEQLINNKAPRVIKAIRRTVRKTTRVFRRVGNSWSLKQAMSKGLSSNYGFGKFEFNQNIKKN